MQAESLKSNTPDRKLRTSLSFSPIGSPNQDLKGISNTGYTLAFTFHSYLLHWDQLQKKGLSICKTIQALNLHQLIGEDYPPQLVLLCETLLEAYNELENIVQGMQEIIKKLNAVTKLSPSSAPLFNTWSATKLMCEVEKFTQMFASELKLKKTVTELIAHCRDENLTEVYVTSWEYNIFITEEAIDYFLAELGLGL